MVFSSSLLLKLCKDLFKKWANLDESHFFAERVAGGITNLLLKVSVKEQNGNTVHVTVRLYGPNTDYVINRERELQAIHYLSAAGFGAKLLGVFGNGMVQSFIHARTLEPVGKKQSDLFGCDYKFPVSYATLINFRWISSVYFLVYVLPY
ncbi:putative ethanolamine kinase [Helianthus annuus]|nr:putative ethanolamine kinase [Helianthus annuus]